MKVYAENYIVLDFGKLQSDYYQVLSATIEGCEGGYGPATPVLMKYYDKLRARFKVSCVVGIVLQPKTMGTVLACFPVASDGTIYSMHWNEKAERHYIEVGEDYYA